MKDNNLKKYTEMQKNYYENPLMSAEDIVGNYNFHENFPYETFLLYKYGDIRRPIFDNFNDKYALDICCGEGRMVRRMNKIFKRCDGCDISEKMLDSARVKTRNSLSYLTNGRDCGPACDNFYDFIFSTISMQHICVYDIRESIINSSLRKLKENGKMTLQLLFSKYYPYIYNSQAVNEDFLINIYKRDLNHAAYFDNKTDASSTNSGCDVVIGEQQIKDIIDDFKRYFLNIDLWFHDISISRNSYYHNNHPNSHGSDSYWGTHFIFIHGAGMRELAQAQVDQSN